LGDLVGPGLVYPGPHVIKYEDLKLQYEFDVDTRNQDPVHS
jgi:hypothetical protein